MVATPQPKRKKLLKKLKSRFRLTVLNEHIERAGKAVFSFGLIGLARTMNGFNTK